MQLYTIGHSAHPIDKFVGLLQSCQIEVLVDVRSAPVSHWHRQYNKNALQQSLAEKQIAYVYAGQQLGGRPKDPSCYPAQTPSTGDSKRPQANFDEIMKREWFVQGIVELVRQVEQTRSAILCSEEAPLQCHRHGLIARYLRQAYPEIEVLHIRGDGRVESAAELFRAGGTQPSEK